MGWIDKIATAVNSAINAIRPPVIGIPPILLLCEIIDRPGLSPISLTSKIIARLPEIGIPTGLNPDGSANMICQLIRVGAEEFIKELQDNGVVDCAIQPGTITITGTGVAAGIAPVAVTGTNVLPSSVRGIFR